MSSIYKRKKQDGSDVFYINLTINGERIRKFAGYSKKVAVYKLKELEYEIQRLVLNAALEKEPKM